MAKKTKEKKENALTIINRFRKEAKAETILFISIANNLYRFFPELNLTLLKGEIVFVPAKAPHDYSPGTYNWNKPTALVASLMFNCNNKDFTKETDNTNYTLVKTLIKQFAGLFRNHEEELILQKPIKVNNNYSKAFSMEFYTRYNKRVKFIFNRDAPVTDWYNHIDTAIDLMAEHYHKENNVLRRKMDKLKLPVKYPLHLVYDKRKKQWEPYIRR